VQAGRRPLHCHRVGIEIRVVLILLLTEPVIRSLKLKSASGDDRSIAHFYRHVDIYPYFNPAMALASALTPLKNSADKSIFMGGSGKVHLTATMHRGTWVAGQRCYVDVCVQNETSKKVCSIASTDFDCSETNITILQVKTLSLSLIRTTVVFRPRPHLTAGNGIDPAHPREIEIDPDACQTSTTKKKVAESVLEMGKKGTKGVTAKGMWMGVAKGEDASFSHSLVVPVMIVSSVDL
jgi:hypothetical protein